MPSGSRRIAGRNMAETLTTIQLSWAAWTSLTAGVVSFTEDWPGPGKPELWWGGDRLQLKALRQLSPGHFGLQGGYCGLDASVSFVLPVARCKGLDLSRGLFVAGSFNGWQAAIGDRDWRLEHGEVGGHACYRLTVERSRFDGHDEATFKFVTGSGHWLEVPPDARNTHVDDFGIKNYLFSLRRTGRHIFRFTTPLPLNQAEGRHLYARIDGEVQSIPMRPGVFLKSLDAPGPFGAIVEGGMTRFRLFAPRARQVRLYVFPNASGPEGAPVLMRLGDDMVWEASVHGNRHGWFYHYSVEGVEVEEAGWFDPKFRVLDPWARAVCGPLGPGIVVEEKAFTRAPDGFRTPRWHDLVIAEAHVRDLAANAPLPLSDEQRLGFDGLRNWVEDESFYLKELGVNAVELQPVHEFDTVNKAEYAWGYMPVNYFSPASQYAGDASRLDQIRAFRELVRSFHDRGMAVILDVVYNHVGEPNYLQYLDRAYYFLLADDGSYENHSGCGNTLDASTPMARRLIRDSLVHWMEAYGVDGFRFDLGELIGKETLAWLESELKKVRPEVVLIAEPWSFRGHIAHELRDATGFASWNDGYREYVREYLAGRVGPERIEFFMTGSRPHWSRFPAQTVNYVESHDDRCWIDKITENAHQDGHRPTANDRRRTHLMAAILLASAGIPMLSSGMDFMKSKGGVNNTYLRGDLNAIPYTRAGEFSGTADYFRRWVAFRRGRHGRLLRLDGFPEEGYFIGVIAGSAFGLIVNANRALGPERLLFVVNPGFEYAQLVFAGQDVNRFRQVADTERWGDPWLRRPHFSTGAEHVVVPPLSCGLFIELENL